MKQKPDYIIDFRGAIASITLLELTNIFREMEVGQILDIFVKDPDTITDIFSVLPAPSYELINMKERDASHYFIRFKKKSSELGKKNGEEK